jgi:hypothetical protein
VGTPVWLEAINLLKVPEESLTEAMVQELHPASIACMLSDQQFVAAGPSRVIFNWRMYFDQLGHGPHTPDILKLLESGYTMDWTCPHAASQEKHPHFKTKMREVQKMVQRLVGEGKATKLLKASKPEPLRFPNRPSASAHAPFVTLEIQELWDRGAIREARAGEAVIVNPLGVVGEAGEKQRLILDARYVNAFVRYTPFHYESLDQLPALALDKSYMLISDLKAGYHHIQVAQEDQMYLGFQWQGRTFMFTVLPFGLASACRVYTEVMEEMYRPIRAMQCTLLSYIDDVAHLAKSLLRARALAVAIPLMLTFLGVTFSASKSCWIPQERGDFLGMTVCLKTQSFFIPSKKAQALLQAISHFQEHQGTNRELAALIGKLISIARAVHLPLLYVRRMFHLLGITPKWDQSVEPENIPFAAGDWQYWLGQIAANLGKSFLPRESREVIKCASDASETGGGGHCDGLLPQPMVLGFSQQDQARMAAGQLSSQVREVRTACYLLRTCMRTNPERVRHGTLICITDNQGAAANMSKLKGSMEEVADIREMMEEAAALDVDVQVIWQPRETDVIQRADALSRVEDHSDFALAPPFDRAADCKVGPPHRGCICRNPPGLPQGSQVFHSDAGTLGPGLGRAHS